LTFSFSILERFRLIDIIGQQESRGIDILLLGKLHDKLYPTQEEKDKCQWVEQYDPSGNMINASFVVDKDFLTEIELTEAEFNRLKQLIDSWPKFVFARDSKWLLMLRTKLGMD
jgi:hypothetical protein